MATTSSTSAGSADPPQHPSPTFARFDKENEIRELTASALKDLPSKTQRPRSYTAETEINSDASGTSGSHTHNNATQLALPPRQIMPPTWDAFVRQGTRLKTLLEDTMINVRNHHSQQTSGNYNNKRTMDNAEDEPPSSRPRLQDRDTMGDMLQEKTTEILRLQRVSTQGGRGGFACGRYFIALSFSFYVYSIIQTAPQGSTSRVDGIASHQYIAP